MVATVRRQEPGYERMLRLAQKARAERVQLLHSVKTGQYFATSGTVSGRRYEVTPHSCTCKGHARFGYCKHRAALQVALGWIEGPVATTATTFAPAACRHCEGRGFWIKARNLGRGRFERYDVPCEYCHGRGTELKAVA